jgi:hypothetical protein
LNITDEQWYDRRPLINKLTKAYRNEDYLHWLRSKACFACGSERRNDTEWHQKASNITASHIFRSYHGLKNHDWGAVPMCNYCHWLYEYHKMDRYRDKYRIPTIADAERYFQRFLADKGREDNRTPEQKVPI